jgi:hypothetical protein
MPLLLEGTREREKETENEKEGVVLTPQKPSGEGRCSGLLCHRNPSIHSSRFLPFSVSW